MINFVKKLIKTGDKDFSQILYHSSRAFVVLSVATALQFFFNLLLARYFGAEGAGIFYLSLSVLTIAALISRLGFDKSVVRFLSPFYSKGSWSEVKGIINLIVKSTFFGALIMSITLYAIAPFLAKSLFSNEELTGYLRIFSLAIIPFSLTYVYAGVLQGMKLVKESLIIERVVIYAGGIFSIVVFGHFYGLSGVFWGFIAFSYLTFYLGFRISSKQLPVNVPETSFDKKKLFSSAVPLLFVTFSNLMFGQVNIIALGILSTMKEVGVFNIALKISLLMGIILVSINSINATKISELYADKQDIQFLASKTSALSLLLVVPLFVIFMVVPEFVLGFFGKEFLVGAEALMILAVGQLFNVGTGSASYILAMTGHEKLLAITISISLLINTILCILLISPFGIMGAALAVTISIICNSFLQVLLVKRLLNIWLLPFKTIKKWVLSLVFFKSQAS